MKDTSNALTIIAEMLKIKGAYIKLKFNDMEAISFDMV